MNKAVLLDRDGTINFDFGYIHKVEDFKFLDGAIEALKLLTDLKYKLIIITNQSGIGRKYFSLTDFKLVNEYMLKVLKNNGVEISHTYMCPHIDSDHCECRKPKLKMFYDAIKEYDIDINNSFVIGDKIRDLAICDKEKINGILISKKYDSRYICKKSLLDAAKYIRKKTEIKK